MEDVGTQFVGRTDLKQNLHLFQFYCIQYLSQPAQSHYNSLMQSKKHVNNPELPVFNIRKVNKKVTVPDKHHLDFNYNLPISQQTNLQFRNYSSVHRASDPRREKQIILDQSVNEAIINSKIYGDLKKVYMENKKKNQQHKKTLEEQIEKKKTEKVEYLQQRERLETEKQKYMEAINAAKQKLEAVREANERYRQSLSNRATGEAEYISNLIMSMRFQAEYQHGIDPDQMTYEQLLELQQKIGVVSKGLPAQLINSLPKTEVKQSSQQRCTVCFGNYEVGEVITKIFNCKHEFHFECLESWLGKEKICPLCKQEVQFEPA